MWQVSNLWNWVVDIYMHVSLSLVKQILSWMSSLDQWTNLLFIAVFCRCRRSMSWRLLCMLSSDRGLRRCAREDRRISRISPWTSCLVSSLSSVCPLWETLIYRILKGNRFYNLLSHLHIWTKRQAHEILLKILIIIHYFKVQKVFKNQYEL